MRTRLKRLEKRRLLSRTIILGTGSFPILGIVVGGRSNYNGQFLEIEIIDMIRFLALLVEKGLVYIFIDHYRS